MLTTLFALAAALGLPSAAAQAANSSTIVCVAGQCLQGFSNTTLGTVLTSPGAVTSVRLLPGQYTTTTNPQLLHTLLTSTQSTLSPSPGFELNSSSSTISLPLNVALQPGLAAYTDALYAGNSSFSSLADASAGGNSSTATPLAAGSLVVSDNVWVALTAGSGNTRVVLWSSVPDVAQLPSGVSGALGLVDLQSSSCSPPCSGNGVCSAQGTCACPAGFTGSSCESCAAGFFGPTCQACPAGCTQCDEGISGSGRCLVAEVANPPSSCNCLNGQCEANGQCTCNSGWAAADNGTACAKCASGFFLSSSGDCQICQLGCTSCADGSGTCLTCASGFTQNANDKTQCIATASTTSSGTVCPDGSFSDGTACKACSPSCKTCSGATSNDCIICGSGQYKLNGSCVGTDAGGVCDGSSLLADNNKHECDSCPAKCTACKISGFNVASTSDQLQCTGCLPGFVLSGGKCVAGCPSGTFLSPTDNLTCTACDSSCTTCAGSATFCLTCANSQLASGGKCVSTCPSDAFSSSGACIACHPDCASCSGAAFNQCASCPPDRPVLTNGRCLPTCAQGQFFDKTSSACVACDASCSSCSAAGPSNCLACSASDHVLQAGSCAAAQCTGSTGVLAGLGVCLSDLVTVPKASASGSAAAPLPTVSGLDTPTQPDSGSSSGRLAWWEILLMALGCAFIFLVVLLCWRRRARRQRAQRTRLFASAKALEPKPSWREWLLAPFRRARGSPARGPVALPTGGAPPPGGEESEMIRLMRVRNAEEARHHMELEKMHLFGAYEYSRAGSAHPPSIRSATTVSRTTPFIPRARDLERESRTSSEGRSTAVDGRSATHDGRTVDLLLDSLYERVTGEARAAPEPRQPVRTGDLLGLSRFSSSTLGTSVYNTRTRAIEETPRAPSPAEAYAADVRANVLRPTHTGSSSGGSNNPFLHLQKRT